MNYLNLGCGHRFHPEWINVDFTSTGEGVIAYNLTQGIPLPDASFDVVYHSHVLEHFPKQNAVAFIKECHRVLRPDGVLRVAVPDLEQLARQYLLALEQTTSGSQPWADNYDWILLEMYDQTVRNHSGGAMAAYLTREDRTNIPFILERCGTEAKILIEAARQSREQFQLTAQSAKPSYPLLRSVYRFLRYPQVRRETFIKLVLGQEYPALQIGRFRQRGEVHQWMYDRYSLAKLLEECGFQQIVQRTATESYIPNWPDFNLDTELDGSVYKPDSLFVEAIKLT